jgi:hypothetical protein
MFNFFRRKLPEPASDDAVTRSLEDQIEQLKEELKNAQEQLLDQTAEASFEIDFDGLKAFSIERIVVKGRGQTNIGYLRDGKIAEWAFACSVKTHERLAGEFRYYKVIRAK